MRFSLLLLFLFSSIIYTNAQPDLTSEQWQADIRYIQHKILEDYKPLFHKITVEEWNESVDNFYNKVPGLDDHEVIVGIAEIIAKFGYGHTALWLTAWRYNRLKNFHQMPYNLYWFSDGIFVQGAHQYYEDAVGAKVIKVGNKTVEDALELIKPVVSSENDSFFKANGLYYLAVPEVLHAKGIIDDISFVTLVLEKNGRQFELRFKSRPSELFPGHYGLIQSEGDWLDSRPGINTPYWLKHLDKKYYFEYLEKEKTAYVRQSEIQDDESEDLPTFYSRVFDFIEKNDVEKMVLDLRLNSGGNNYKNKPVITGLIDCKKINQTGKLFVIIGRRTFSACQNLVNELETYTKAIFIGEPTAENVNFFGDTRTETLPNSNLSIKLSYLWWQDKDPRDKRLWTPPHMAMEMASTDYFTNNDPVFNKILSTNKFEKPIDPWSHLVNLYTEGKLDELRITARVFMKDPSYRFFDFEDRINNAGDQLLTAGSYQEAVVILEINSELFPESPRCWNSLGQAYWKYGEPVKAREYFQKTITMDPDGIFGRQAKEMLTRMEKHD